LHNKLLEAILNAGHEQAEREDALFDEKQAAANVDEARGDVGRDPTRRELKKKAIMLIPKTDRQIMRQLNLKRKVCVRDSLFDLIVFFDVVLFMFIDFILFYFFIYFYFILFYFILFYFI